MERKQLKIYEKRLSSEKTLRVFLFDSERKTAGQGKDKVVTYCPEASIPGCEIRVEIVAETGLQPLGQKFEPHGLENALRKMGDYPMLLDFRGSKNWGVKETVFLTAMEASVNALLKQRCPVRCSVTATGEIQLDIKRRTDELYFPDQDMSSANNRMNVPGMSSTLIKVGRHLGLETALTTALAYIQLQDPSDDLDSLPVTGVIIITDTEPFEELPDYLKLQSIPIKVFGIWPRTRPQTSHEKGLLAIPLTAFQRDLRLWDSQAVILTTSFLGLEPLSYLPEVADYPAAGILSDWGTVQLVPEKDWLMMARPLGAGPAEQPEVIPGGLEVNLLSEYFSRDLFVVPAKAMDEDNMECDMTPSEMFASLVPGDVNAPIRYMRLCTTGAGKRELAMTSQLIYRPERKPLVRKAAPVVIQQEKPTENVIALAPVSGKLKSAGPQPPKIVKPKAKPKPKAQPKVDPKQQTIHKAFAQ